MHNAELHLGSRKDRLHRVGQPRQPIDTGHATIVASSLPEIRKHRSPDFGSFGLTDPEAYEVFFPREGNAQRHRDRFGFDGSVMPRFDKETIERENRIDRFQGTTLPKAHILSDRIGHGGDECRRHLRPIYLFEVALTSSRWP